jgi:electron transfer flavoprotein beta subunit
VDSEKKKVTAAGAPPVLSPFDENALEAALRIKDNYGGKITVLSMGKKLAQRVLIKSLAAGADEMVLLQDDAFEDLDSFGTACTLAAAIRKIGEFDIIFCGILAADTNEGQVGLATAEILGIPAVTLVQKIEPGNGKLKVEQVLPEGYDVLDVPMPALLTVGSELYELRYPSIIALKEAKKKPVTIWNAQDVGVDVTQIKRKKIVTLYPRVSATTCEVIGGENMKAVGINLALKLRDAGII